MASAQSVLVCGCSSQCLPALKFSRWLHTTRCGWKGSDTSDLMRYAWGCFSGLVSWLYQRYTEDVCCFRASLSVWSFCWVAGDTGFSVNHTSLSSGSVFLFWLRTRYLCLWASGTHRSCLWRPWFQGSRTNHQDIGVPGQRFQNPIFDP